ncbi:hypothetical protein EVAR_8943_1 [Eumeta japonica]|uniref:Uncharacterized protein n=1 Tax=Eumeta variegata TaxID=151549 RepID=A0A4C1U0E4_EUMVA|nr:hypothetical protein EVAR_8943_1 [Eumeta japonica]
MVNAVHGHTQRQMSHRYFADLLDENRVFNRGDRDNREKERGALHSLSAHTLMIYHCSSQIAVTLIFSSDNMSDSAVRNVLLDIESQAFSSRFEAGENVALSSPITGM